MIQSIGSHAKLLMIIAIGMMSLVFAGGGISLAADVSAATQNNIYELSVTNYGSAVMQGVTVEPLVSQNPQDLIVIQDVQPQAADIPGGAVQVFTIPFDVKCPSSISDTVETARFKFTIHTATGDPFYINPCGINAENCGELEADFTVAIKRTECEKCENNQIVDKTPEEIGTCNECVDEKIQPKELPPHRQEGQQCIWYKCDDTTGGQMEQTATIPPPDRRRCVDYICTANGVSAIPIAGCDAADDNESVDPSYETTDDEAFTIDENAGTGILTNGFFNDAAAFVAGLTQENLAWVPIGFSYADVADKPLLIIPSGGLYGMDNSPSFQHNLEQYIANGGTVIVFSQQHGYEFRLLPGNLSGYGWSEDLSCQWKSMYVDTYHQILSGIDTTQCDAVVDGYFTDWPDDSIILLRRTKNSMPCMLMYRHGNGWVIATTIYEDWASNRGQVTADGKSIVRDLCRWGTAPMMLPEFAPETDGETVTEITNRTGSSAAQIKLSVYNPDNIRIQEEVIPQTIDSGQTLILDHQLENIPRYLGIWFTQYALLDREGNPVQAESKGSRFVVSVPPESGEDQELGFSMNSEQDTYVYGSTGTFTLTGRNDSDQEKTVTYRLLINHRAYNETVYAMTVPPNSVQQVEHSVKMIYSDSARRQEGLGVGTRFRAQIFNEAGQKISEPSVTFRTRYPYLHIDLACAKNNYNSGEDVTVSMSYTNKGSGWNSTAGFRYESDIQVVVTGPENTEVFRQEYDLTVSDLTTTEIITFTLPEPARAGPYKITATGYVNGNKQTATNEYISVPTLRVGIEPNLPAILEPGSNTISFNINRETPGGVYPGSPGIFTAVLRNPAGSTIWESDEITFDPSGNAGTAIEMVMPLENLTFGNYTLFCTADYGYARQAVFGSNRFVYSAGVETNLLQDSFRTGETLQLDVDVTNTGNIGMENMDVRVHIPDAGFSREYTTSLTPGQTSRTSMSCTIPDTITPGRHSGIVEIVSANSTKEHPFHFWVPPSQIVMQLDGLAYDAGTGINMDVRNIGGIHTEADYTISLLDEEGKIIAENQGAVFLNIDKIENINITIPDAVLSGRYNVMALVTDRSTNVPSRLSQPITVNGTNAIVDVSTDQQVYFSTDPKTVLAEVTVNSGRMDKGNLHLQIWKDRNSGVKTWTNREDWQTGELKMVDITTTPGDVVPVLDNGTGDADPNSRKIWSVATGAWQLASPAIDTNGFLYFGSAGRESGGVLYVFNTDGTIAWTYETMGGITAKPIIADDGTIYIAAADGNIYALSSDGSEKWIFETGNQQSVHAAAGPDGTLYAASEGSIYAVSPKGEEKWKLKTEYWGFSTPIPGLDGTVYVSSGSGLLAVNSIGSEKWLFPTNDWVSVPPAVGGDNTIYMSGDDGTLNALNPDGTVKWTFETNGWNLSRPCIGPDGNIFVVVDEMELHAISQQGGDRWSYQTDTYFSSTPGIGMDGTIYIGLEEFIGGALVAINPDGSEHWRYQTENAVQTIPLLGKNGTVYFGTGGGDVFAVSDTGRSIRLTFDAGDLVNWGRFGYTATLSDESAISTSTRAIAVAPDEPVIRVSTRTAETEAALSTSSWSTYSTPENNPIDSTGICSQAGRWIEIELNFENSIMAEDTLIEYFPVLHDLFIEYQGGSTVWEQDFPISTGDTESVSVPVDFLQTEGRYQLRGQVTNSLSQSVAADRHTFYVDNNHIRLVFETGQMIYQPGKTVQVTGKLINTLSDPASGRNLRFTLDDQVVFTETVDLEADGEHLFAFDFEAPDQSAILSGWVDSREVASRLAVAEPSLTVAMEPETAGRAAFDFTATLTNQGAVDCEIVATIADEAFPLQIPAGQSTEIEKTFRITGDTTVPVVISGDINQTINHAIDFCEDVDIVFSPAEVYSEGMVAIPYTVKNTGCTDTTIDLTVSLNGETIVKPIFVSAGEGLTDNLIVSLGAGDYDFAYSSFLGQGNLPIKVAGPNQLAMRLDVQYPETPRVLVLKDGLTEPDVADILTDAGVDVTIASAYEYEWDGTNPGPEGFHVVILLDGGTGKEAMPVPGQEALTRFVENGGGLLMTEWITAENAENHYTEMEELLLFDPDQYAYTEGSDTFYPTIEHPVADGLSKSIAVPLLAGNTGAVKAGVEVLLSGKLLPHALAVKEYGFGRIVQYAFSGNDVGKPFIANNDMETLLINSVKWAAHLPLAGHFNTTLSIENSGDSEFLGELEMYSDFFTEYTDLALQVGEKKIINLDFAAEGIDPGQYPITAVAYESGNVIQQITQPVEIQGPEFILRAIPKAPEYIPGQEASMTVAVQNTGMVEGLAEVGLDLLDRISETRYVWIPPGAVQEITFNFTMEDDLAAKEYSACLYLAGNLTEIPFVVGGVDVGVSGSLDKSLYTIGDTAALTLAITSSSKQPTDMIARMISGDFEDSVAFTLDGNSIISFSMPITENTPNKLIYGVYFADGRSVQLDSLPIYFTDAVISLYPDKNLYQPGEEVAVKVNTEQTGDLILSAPGYEDTLPISGNTHFRFILPPEMVSGSYAINYQFGDTSGRCTIYVKGFQTKVLELVLDQPIYEPVDTMDIRLLIDTNYAVSGIVKGWIYHPDGQYAELFETMCELSTGQNRIHIQDAGFTTTEAGIHWVVYAVYKADTMTELLNSGEVFEVQQAAVTDIALDQEIFNEADPVSASVSAYACSSVAGQVELLLNGEQSAIETVLLNGSKNLMFNMGCLQSGSYTLTARLRTNGEIVSEKSTLFQVADLTAPATPTGFQVTIQGNTAVLSWDQNTENDLAGYHVYRNDSRVTPVALTRNQYKDSGLASEIPYRFRVAALDHNGNLSTPSIARNVVIDSTPPEIVFNPAFDTSAVQPVSMNYWAVDNHDPSPLLTANYPSPTLFYITGDYAVYARAVDDSGNSSEKSVRISILISGDTDNDGMRDDWEMQYFHTLDRDGRGDYDHDGLSDLTEFRNGTSPVSSNAPALPAINEPADHSETTTRTPALTIHNSIDPDGDPITYTFELYRDEGFTCLVAGQYYVPETQPNTAWQVPETLQDNTWYYWRTRATDGNGYTPWVYGRFFVNTTNDPPSPFPLNNPSDNTEVSTLTPILEISNSTDMDGDAITYSFEVYADPEMTDIITAAYEIAAEPDNTTQWTVDTILDDNTWYYWRAIATDEHGAWTETVLQAFFVNTANDSPEAPVIVSPVIDSEIQTVSVSLKITNSLDRDGDVLTYRFEIDTAHTFDSPDAQRSGDVEEGAGTTKWPVENLTDNTLYYWRAKAFDGFAESAWSIGRFLVNTENDMPTTPGIKNPSDGAWVDTLTPTLELHAAQDLDMDQIQYEFQVCQDVAFTIPVCSGASAIPGWTLTQTLADHTWYYWRARAVDEHDLPGPWTETQSFYTDSNGMDDPPAFGITEPSTDILTNGNTFLIQWEDSDPDSDAVISLFYDVDATGGDGVLIAGNLAENPDGDADTHEWDISRLRDGAYYIYGVITDDNSPAVVNYAEGALIIDRTPPEITATPGTGVYDTAQQVTLTADEPSTIYYTMDGTPPTPASVEYIVPIEIASDTELQYIAVDTAGNQSDINTALYTITEPNVPPQADAGEDHTIYLGETARLDGSGSHDPDDGPQPLAFFWYFLNLPTDSSLVDDSIVNPDTATPSFIPDVSGAYRLQLEVNDGKDITRDTVNVIVTLDNGLHLSTSVILGEKTVSLGPWSRVFSGDIAVTDKRGSLFWDFVPEVIVYPGAELKDGVVLFGDTVTIQPGASVADVHYNHLNNRGTIRGTEYTPFALPQALDLPEFPLSEPGTRNITVKKGCTKILEPGAYGKIVLKNRSRLVLTGGTYQIRNLELKGIQCAVPVQDSTRLIISEQLKTSHKAYIGPEEDSGISAKDIKIYVAGQGSAVLDLLDQAKAVFIGNRSRIRASLYAPDSTIWVMSYSEMEGAMIGKHVILGGRVRVSVDNGFATE